MILLRLIRVEYGQRVGKGPVRRNNGMLNG